jgi:hypothetical protein
MLGYHCKLHSFASHIYHAISLTEVWEEQLKVKI